VKRGNFIRELVAAGCYLKRHGNRHDIYANPINGKQAPIPFQDILKLKKAFVNLSDTNWVFEN
jgi:hypothetical protein